MHRYLPSKLRDQLRGIVLLLRLFNSTLQVAIERLLSPWAVDRVGDGSESGYGPILLRSRAQGVEVYSQSAMSTHGVSKDRLAREVL